MFVKIFVDICNEASAKVKNYAHYYANMTPVGERGGNGINPTCWSVTMSASSVTICVLRVAWASFPARLIKGE